MSILLNSIDCPYLTNDCLNILIEHYSIHTTNDFLLYFKKSSAEINKHLPLNTIECIHSCILAHTGVLLNREIKERHNFQVNYLLFDQENLFKIKRHLIFIYEYFNQDKWNEFFNIFLIRLFIQNPLIKIKYLNTNRSLFDLNYFYSYYCNLNTTIENQRNDIFEKSFYFDQCFDLETFESELKLLENNNHESIQILILDDFFSLIKSYLNLDRRIKNKILQLTYHLNRLAQKQSILIINGIIFNTKTLQCFDTFHADQYILFQSLSTTDKYLDVQILNNKKFKLDLNDWKKL